MVEANPAATDGEHQSYGEAASESNRHWAISFDLERTMADYHDNDGAIDLDEVSAFVELITRDQTAVVALRSVWDPR